VDLLIYQPAYTPWLKRPGTGTGNADQADGVPGLVAEFAGKNDFIADHGTVDRAGLVGRDALAHFQGGDVEKGCVAKKIHWD
jgi:hypothetical protein